MLTYLLFWFPMLFIAILNGTLREFVFVRHMNEHTARQLSTITLLIFFAIYIWLVIRRFPPATGSYALLIGLMWMAMTLLFEFGFGAYSGRSFDSMLQEYNLFKGNIWIFVPLWLAIAPSIFYHIYPGYPYK